MQSSLFFLSIALGAILSTPVLGHNVYERDNSLQPVKLHRAASNFVSRDTSMTDSTGEDTDFMDDCPERDDSEDACEEDDPNEMSSTFITGMPSSAPMTSGMNTGSMTGTASSSSATGSSGMTSYKRMVKQHVPVGQDGTHGQL
ncbi:hypothetical protein M422DRAFT_258886 [Sphaerobolus stellatus SS14]|uniref:Uncharacterized protein n=1 Tax=Sphaerobolus stellatus (strain SS14) TaxID=990650 RepID=A0A0C9VLP8_SPHS4|nr:hypothetical protein M422DRAFT_266185 [Sphaerobolus stellatus SS14]KIJ38516.1 hypothetical protein M422DRAFT_258886 [Sphaerobolus stellatus SS14]